MDIDLVRFARTLSRPDFVERFPGPYLVVTLDPSQSPIGGFETAVRRSKERSALTGKDVQVLRITKASGNPYPDRISVGRTGNCDLVIRDPSVSKLHAHFTVDADGQLVLVDQRSSNGTLVNGTAAMPGVSEPVELGDVVQFGQVRATVLDAAAVYDTLQRTA